MSSHPAGLTSGQGDESAEKVRFPIINNFSSTLDYKKNSRDLAELQHQKDKLTSAVGVEQAYNLNSGSIKHDHKHRRDPHYQNHQALAKAKASIDSSIDDEMLDKIKNIYSEMRGVPGVKPLQGTAQQFYTQQQAVSTNNRPTKMSSLRQKRLMTKGSGASVEPLVDSYQSGAKSEARHKPNAKGAGPYPQVIVINAAPSLVIGHNPVNG